MQEIASALKLPVARFVILIRALKFVACGTLIGTALFLLSLSQTPVRAATLTTFDAPGALSTSPVSVNRFGAITGSHRDGPGDCDVHGFIRTPNGTISSFDAQGSPGSLVATYPAAINDAGDIAGTYYEAPNCSHPVAHGFLLTAAGTTISFDFASCTCFLITGMNNQRTIIGYYIDTSDGSIHGMVRSRHGRLTSFEAPGATYTRPVSINDQGFITGTAEDSHHQVHGFVRSPHGHIARFDVSGATTTYPRSINDQEEIAGNTVVSQVGRGFIREADGTIALFDIQDGSSAEPHAINSRAWTTGLYFDTTARRYRGFLRKSSSHTDTFEAGAVSKTEGLAINHAGAITGDYFDSNGMPHGFIRTP